MEMIGVQEYCDDMLVQLVETVGLYKSEEGKGRMVIKAFNEGGFNSTEVDLLHLLKWLKVNKPDILKEAGL